MEAILELKLDDKTNSDMPKWNQSDVPPTPGRGLVTAIGVGIPPEQIDKEDTKMDMPVCNHMIFAQPFKSEPGSLEEHITQYTQRVNTTWSQHRSAPKTPILPDRIALADIAAPLAAEALLAGVRQVDLEPQIWDTTVTHHLACLGLPKSGKTALLATLCSQLDAQQKTLPDDLKPYVLIISPNRTLSGIVAEGLRTEWTLSAAKADNLLTTFLAQLPQSKNIDDMTQTEYMEYQAQSRGQRIREHFVIIDDLHVLNLPIFDKLLTEADRAESTGLRIAFTFTPAQMGITPSKRFVEAFKTLSAAAILLNTDEGHHGIWGKERGARREPGRGIYLTANERMLIQVPLTEHTPIDSENID